MTTWAINGQTFAARELSGVTREIVNMGVDRMAFTAPGRAIDASTLFAYDTLVTVTRDGQPFFSGCAGRTPKTGTPQAESHSYEILGPWEQLTRQTFMQRWQSGRWEGETWTPYYDYRSRIVIGQTEAGAAMTVGQVISSVIDYAAGCGIQIAAGTIDAGPCFPWEEAVDISCADVIRRVARWCPQSIGWVDYSSTPPKFHFRERSALWVKTFAVGSTLSSVNLTQIGARSVPAVVLKYESTVDNNGTPVVYTIPDAYPVGSTGRELGAVVQTIQLSGGSVHRMIQSQDIKCLDIPEMVVNAALLTWFLQRNPAYAGVTGLTITSVSRDRFDLVYELFEGSLQDWMRVELPDPDNPGGMIYNPDHKYAFRDGRCTITFHVQYTIYDDSGTPLRVVSDEVVTNQITATTAQTGRYYRSTSDSSAGEAIPQGLAQTLYASLNANHHQGSLTILEEEIGAAVYLGCRVLITGGDPAWATMSAVVQAVTDSLDTGETIIRVGPPAHLTPSEIMDLRRANRTRHVADSAGSRISGEAYSGGVVELGSAIPVRHSVPGPERWGVRVEVITAVRVSGNAIQAKRRTAVVAYLDAESDWETVSGGQGEECS